MQAGGSKKSHPTLWRQALCPFPTTDAHSGKPPKLSLLAGPSGEGRRSHQVLSEGLGSKCSAVSVTPQHLSVPVLTTKAAHAVTFMNMICTFLGVRNGLGMTNHPLVQRIPPGRHSYPTRRLASLCVCTCRRITHFS